MTDLQELFDRDPASHSKQDRALIIAELRKMRASFNTAKTPATKTPKKKSEAAATASEIGIEL
jgi:hypothetical protein